MFFRVGGGHIYYAEREDEYVEFGDDVQSGIGPETASLAGDGHYILAVHQYSKDGSLTDSEAVMEVTTGPRWQRSIQRFTVPAGSGRWWHVAMLDLSQDSVVALEKLSDDPPAL